MSARTRAATKALRSAQHSKVVEAKIDASPTAIDVTAPAAAPPLPTACPTLVGVGHSDLPVHLFGNADAWESWLETNHIQTAGIWLKISKKGSGIPSVTYDEAVDVALCFGWIDGQRKSLDANHFVQRFTPRRKNSIWSKRNVDKIATLAAAGRIRPPGQDQVDAAKADGRWARAYSSSSIMEVPADFQVALERNATAKAFFDTLNKTKRYSYLWRIETAKKPETRKKKIAQCVALLAEQKAP